MARDDELPSRSRLRRNKTAYEQIRHEREKALQVEKLKRKPDYQNVKRRYNAKLDEVTYGKKGCVVAAITVGASLAGAVATLRGWT